MAGTLKIRNHQIQVPDTLKSYQTPQMMMAKEANSAKICSPHFRPSDNEINIWICGFDSLLQEITVKCFGERARVLVSAVPGSQMNLDALS